MKKILKHTLLLVPLTIIVMSCSIDASLHETNEDYPPSIDLSLSQQTDWPMAFEILNLVNTHRMALGKPAIELDTQLASAYAVDHTAYMITMGAISHDNFNIRSQGLIDAGALFVSENVAYGYTSPEQVVTAWLSSPIHRAIIEGNYSHSGFGILNDANGGYYFTQLFYKK